MASTSIRFNTEKTPTCILTAELEGDVFCIKDGDNVIGTKSILNFEGTGIKQENVRFWDVITPNSISPLLIHVIDKSLPTPTKGNRRQEGNIFIMVRISDCTAIIRDIAP